MKRTVAREIAVQIIFGSETVKMDIREFAEDFLNEERFLLLKGESEIYDEIPDSKSISYINDVIKFYTDNKEKIDKLISDNSKGWKLNRISSTALAVLRVAVCEILFFDNIPIGVSINSAVVIDRGYDDEDVVAYVNGVLGSIAKSIDG